jgi:uncharacterized protein (DUF2062 family)
MIQITKAALKRWLEALLHTHDTPRRTALAYAFGVFCGFSPFLGLHTVLGVVCAFAFNLNRVAVLLGVYTNLPWIVPAYYTLVTIGGAALLGTDVPPNVGRMLRDAFAATTAGEFRTLIDILWPIVWSYTVGSILGAALLAGLAYWAALGFVLAHRRHLAQQGARHKP